MLCIIGLGLHDEKDISLRGLEAIKQCDTLYLENYTSALCKREGLEALYGKKIITAERALVEQTDELLTEAQSKNVGLLVIGDPLAATTHLDIIMRAKKKNIEVKIIHNASVMTAVASTGLQLYKFGKTVTVPYPEKNFMPETYYEVVRQNQMLGLHTLLLLDLKPNEEKFMSILEAITLLEELEKKKQCRVIASDTLFIGCARLGSEQPHMVAGTAEQLKPMDFGKPPYCLVVVGMMHFMEEEALDYIRKTPSG